MQSTYATPVETVKSICLQTRDDTSPTHMMPNFMMQMYWRSGVANILGSPPQNVRWGSRSRAAVKPPKATRYFTNLFALQNLKSMASVGRMREQRQRPLPYGFHSRYQLPRFSTGLCCPGLVPSWLRHADNCSNQYQTCTMTDFALRQPCRQSRKRKLVVICLRYCSCNCR